MSWFLWIQNRRITKFKCNESLEIPILEKRDFNFINYLSLKYEKKINRNIMNDIKSEMHLQLISIPGWDNKSLTISVSPFSDAIINGVPEKDAIGIP